MALRTDNPIWNTSGDRPVGTTGKKYRRVMSAGTLAGDRVRNSAGEDLGKIEEIMNKDDLFLEQIKDLYDAEKQLVKALPKLAKAANSEDLRQGFQEHLEQTKGHLQRLEQIFEMLGKKASGSKCEAMQGLVEEGAEVIDKIDASPLRDAALLGAAQKVEHYEIAGYGTCRTFAQI